MNTRTVIVVSGDALFSDCLRLYFDGVEDWSCVGFHNDGLAAMAAIGRQEPSAVLITNDLARLGAAALARQVIRRWPNIAVVVLDDEPLDDVVTLPADVGLSELMSALEVPGRPQARDLAGQRDGMARLADLTKRERTVLRMIALGEDTAGIAASLQVTENTVRTHLQNLYSKLDCHSRLDVVRFALSRGVVTPEQIQQDS